MTFPRRLVEIGPGLILVCGIAAIVGAMAHLPASMNLRLAPLGPIISFSTALGDGATALVLFATWRHSAERRAIFVLALAFALNGGLLSTMLLVSALLPSVPPIFWSPPQTGVWISIIWHFTAGIGALLYILTRNADKGIRPTRQFQMLASLATILLLAIGISAAFVLGALVPLVNEPSLTGIASTYVGPVVAAFLAVVAIRTFIAQSPNIIDRALTLSLTALALDMLVVPLTVRFSDAFYASRVLLLLGGAFVLIASLRTLVMSRYRLSEVEDESFKRAGRIRAVWEIASYVARPDGDQYETILGIATAAMRPGMGMFGTVSHLDGEEIVFDATSWRGSEADPGGFATRVHAGARFPRDLMLQDRLFAAGHTMAWNDLGAVDDSGRLSEALDLRSFIGTPVNIGRGTYFLGFASPETMRDEPFVNDDLAYVDVVASFFASSFKQQQQFERIQFQIEHDALTGLENRVQFRKAIRDEIRTGEAFTLAFVDLDEFRRVNERHGHQIGDEVLVEVAAALTSVSSEDLVARMSADEFGLLIRNSLLTGQTGELQRYGDLFHTPFHTGDRDGTQLLSIGASIGGACYPLDGANAEDLMRKADVALTVAKDRGGSSAIMFDSKMGEILEEEHLRVIELSDAIAQDQLALVYQPTFDLATRAIIGAEALVRWDHPERGRLPPGDFIDFAERNGLIGAVTRWVLRRVVHDVSSAVTLPSNVRIYFNVAAQMLGDVSFIAELNEAIRGDGQLVDHLGIEVTETAAMENVERSMNTIDLIRKWGIKVAIDDFGTGYSSLSYLKELRVDVIKIDRSFITGLPDDERDTAVAEMLLRITDRFGFATLAEGIETEAQAAWLLQHGCRYGQGFLVARPESFDEMLGRMGVTYAA
jgi:diguanylate cyclase (GGDEF)-like protein